MVAIVVAVPASARNSARVFGVITDRDGEPVAGAAITPEFVGGLARNYELTTNEMGEFLRAAPNLIPNLHAGHRNEGGSMKSSESYGARSGASLGCRPATG